MAAQLNYNYDTAKGVPGGKAYIDFDKVVTRRNENEGYGEEKCFEIPMWRGIGNESVDTDVAELLSKGSERK